MPHLDAARSVPARAAAVYRQSAHLLGGLDRPMRACQLELTAHRLGCRGLAADVTTVAPDRPWQTRWSHGRRSAGYQVISGHDAEVTAVAAGTLPDGTPVIISGSYDGTVRVWRMAGGTPIVPAIDLTGWVPAVATYGNVIITAAEADIVVHQLVPRAHTQAVVLFPHSDRPMK